METNLKKKAGLQLQLLRLERNLTQEQMSEKLNLSTSAYCKIEYGETDLTLTRLDQLAKALNIPILELFCRINKCAHADVHRSNSPTRVTKDHELNDDLRELVRANSRAIDLLCKRIDALEQKG